MIKIKNILFEIVKKIFPQLLIYIYFNRYLKEIGWKKSLLKGYPIDINNNPIPWVTYGFIDFVTSRLNRTMDVLEYGSGASTLWYAKKVKSVHSIEHNKVWYEKIKNNTPENVFIYYMNSKDNEEYAMAPSQIKKKFDLIVIDGESRVDCITNCLEFLKKKGAVVLDDSEREMYKEGIDFLRKKGFRRIDFKGFCPGITYYNKSTTFFYKTDNSFGV